MYYGTFEYLVINKQILEAAPYKTAAVQALSSHLINHPNKMAKDELISNVLLWTTTHGHIVVEYP